MEKRTVLFVFLLLFLCGHALQAHGFWKEGPISIYPNPARENLTVEFTGESFVQPEIQIIDLTGKVVIKVEEEVLREDKLFKADIELKNLNTGIYFVKVIQAKKIYTMKLVIE